MQNIEIYTINNCTYCTRAKSLLKEKKLEFNERNIMCKPEFMIEMVSRTNKRTMPQIFIGGVSIGGYDELEYLNNSGDLERYF